MILRMLLTSKRWRLVIPFLITFFGIPALIYYTYVALLIPSFELAGNEAEFPVLLVHRNETSGVWDATAMSYSQAKDLSKNLSDYFFSLPKGFDPRHIGVRQPIQNPGGNHFSLHRARVRVRELPNGWQRLQVTVWGDHSVKIIGVSEARGHELRPRYYRYIIQGFMAVQAAFTGLLINIPLWGAVFSFRWLCRRGRASRGS